MSRTVKICDATALGEGCARSFDAPAASPTSQGNGIVIRFEGRIHAYENRCQHLPLPLDYGDGQFLTPDGRHLICRNHGALYDPATGLCVHGPCLGASLRPLPIRVEEGEVRLVLGD